MQTNLKKFLSILLTLVMLVGMLPTVAFAYGGDKNAPYFITDSTEYAYTLPTGQIMTLFDKDGMYSNHTNAYDHDTGEYLFDEETGEPILIRADIGKDFIYVVKSGDRYYTFGDVSSSNSLRTSIPAVDITDWVDAANGTVTIPEDTKNVMFLSYTKWGSSNFGLTANGHDRLFGYEYKKVDEENGEFHFDLYFKFENTQKDRSGRSFSWYNDDTDPDGYLTGFTDYWDREFRYHIYPVLRENSSGMKYFGLTSKHIDETMNENAKLYELSCRHQSTVDYLPHEDPTCMDRGSEEFWYCHGCEEYFSDADLTQFIGIDHPQIEALGHDYGEETCSRCGRDVPVYRKISTKAELDALSNDASFIVVAEYNGQTYVLGNNQTPESEFKNPYLEWGDVLAVPVTKNTDGSISVLGTEAVEFQMTPQFSAEEIEALKAEIDPEYLAEVEAELEANAKAVYQFITPGRFFKAPGMNKIVRNYKQMLWFEGDNRVWKVYFYNELKDLGLDSIERGFVDSMTFEDTNLVLAYHWPSVDEKEKIPLEQSVRLRDYNSTVSFVCGSNYNLEGFGDTQYTDENGNEKSTDKQAAVYLYASDVAYNHTHEWGAWRDNLNGFHVRNCTVSGCTAKETGAHMWGDMTSDNDKTHSHTCSVCNLTVAEAHDLSTNKVDDNTHETTCRWCDYSVPDSHNMSVYSAWGAETHSSNCSECIHWYEEDCNFTIPVDRIETTTGTGTETKIIYQCEKCANTKTVVAETADTLGVTGTGTEGIAMNIPSYVEGGVENVIIPVGTVFEVSESNEQPGTEAKDNIDAAVNDYTNGDVQSDVLVTYNMALFYKVNGNDADAVNVQPGGNVDVTIPKPQSEEEYDGYVVVYTSDEGEAETHETTDNGDTLTFTTNHFSKYAVVGYKAKTTSTLTYSVTIAAGAGMSTTGSANQTGLTGAMTSVVYMADATHYFPIDYSVTPVNGISVTRDSYTQITVSGTPEANTTIELPAATARVQESKPEAYTAGQSENSVLLNGAAPKCLYSIDSGNTWTVLNNYTVLIGNVTTEHGIWVKCPTSIPNTGLDSEIQKITITKAATPAPTIDYYNERFEGLAANSTFSVTVDDETETIATRNLGRIKIREEWIGKTVTIVQVGGRNELYSAAYTITLPARSTDVPTGVTATDCTSESPYIGSINGVDNRMEISLKGEDGWLSVPEGETSVMYSYGEYEVRFKATDNSFASSASAYVTINEYVAPVNAETPTISVQPADRSYNQNQPADALSVNASVSDGGTLTYQWYSNTTNSNEGGTELGGETGTSYTPSTATVGTTYYYCVVTNTNNSVNGNKTATATSNVVAIVVKSGSSGGYVAPTYSIETAKTENGSVSVSPEFAAKGKTVTITATPDKGYELDALTVLDKNGKEVKLTEKDGKYSFEMPASKVTVKASFKKIAVVNPFIDVKNGDYFYDAVLWAVEKNITSGTSDTTFSPNEPCTRGQIVTFLWRAAGSPEAKSAAGFSDVSADAYYAKAVAWAVENGITVGTSATTFSPDEVCTRAQAVTFLSRALKGKAAAAGSAFSDVAANSYYAEAVAWAAENGITSGTSATTFSPDEVCTRGQIVTLLFRAMAE